MNEARQLIKFLKIAAPAPGGGGGGRGGQQGSAPLNPVQLAVQQQQAAALGEATPEGNPEVMKAQESSIQAQQQAAQQIAQTQQQAQQEVMKAQQQAQEAQMKAMGQAQGQIQKLQSQLEKAQADALKAKTESELSSLEKQKAELFQPEPEKPEPVAPGVDHRPTLKRMSNRIGKALSRLEQIAPHFKMAAVAQPSPVQTPPPQPPLPYKVQPDGKTIDIDTTQQTYTPQQSPGYNNPGAGQVWQNNGNFNQAVLSIPDIRPSMGMGGIGDKVMDQVRQMLYAKPDYPQHFRNGFFESSNPFEMAMPWQMQQQFQQPAPQYPWWQQMASSAVNGFAGAPPPQFY